MSGEPDEEVVGGADREKMLPGKQNIVLYHCRGGAHAPEGKCFCLEDDAVTQPDEENHSGESHETLGMLRARQIVLLQKSTETWSLDRRVWGRRERLEKIV